MISSNTALPALSMAAKFFSRKCRVRPAYVCVHYPTLWAKNVNAAEADIPLVAPRPSVFCDCERGRTRVKELPSSLKKKRNLQPYASFEGRRETQANPWRGWIFRHPSPCLQSQVTDMTLGFPQEGLWWWWWLWWLCWGKPVYVPQRLMWVQGSELWKLN